MSRALVLTSLALIALVAPAAPQTEISGFVDASWFLDGNSGIHTFGLDQAEVDVVRTAADGVVLRADLEWVKDGDAWVQAVEQGFLAWSPAALDGATLTFGRFNAPIGFEQVDAPDMYQYSHGLLFEHATPANLTGVMVAHPLGGPFDICAYWVDGWDVNHVAGDGPETFGGRLGYDLGDLGGVGLSGIAGNEIDKGDPADPLDDLPFDRTVIDVDLTLTPAEGWLIGGELNLGTAVPEGGAEGDWTGLMIMANHRLSERVGLTLRFDRLDDPDGAVFGNGKEVRSSLTISPTFALDEGLTALFELRQDASDREIWFDADGRPTDTALTAALEVTAVF